MSFKIDNPYHWPIIIPDSAFPGNVANVGVTARANYTFGGLTNPNPGDNVVIGAHQFDFVAGLGAPGATTQVLIGAGLANTGLSLQHAVNGTTDATVVPAIGYTPYNLFAIFSTFTGILLIVNAVSPGGAPTPGTQPLALSTASTTGSFWDCTGLDATGRTATTINYATQAFIVDANMIAAGGFDIGISLRNFIWQVTRIGTPVVITTDSLIPISGRLRLTLGVDIQANDVVTIIAFGS